MFSLEAAPPHRAGLYDASPRARCCARRFTNPSLPLTLLTTQGEGIDGPHFMDEVVQISPAGARIQTSFCSSVKLPDLQSSSRGRKGGAVLPTRGASEGALHLHRYTLHAF